MNFSLTERGIEMVPVSDTDRKLLINLKTRFPSESYFSYDLVDGSEAGLIIINEEE